MSLTSSLSSLFQRRRRPTPQAARRRRRALLSVGLLDGPLAVEALEDRVMLTVTISYDSGTLDVAAANSASAKATITCTETENSSETEWTITTTGDTLSLGTGTTNGNLSFTLTKSISEVTITEGNSEDISSLNIGGPIGGDEEQTTDINDTVTLGNITIIALNVSAKTINFQGGTADVFADDLTLQSVNSLTFPTTGVPYQGTMTIHAPIPAGQPFAGDAYITGPDWGRIWLRARRPGYGYQ